jgi:hypothetical protein
MNRTGGWKCAGPSLQQTLATPCLSVRAQKTPGGMLRPVFHETPCTFNVTGTPTPGRAPRIPGCASSTAANGSDANRDNGRAGSCGDGAIFLRGSAAANGAGHAGQPRAEQCRCGCCSIRSARSKPAPPRRRQQIRTACLNLRNSRVRDVSSLGLSCCWDCSCSRAHCHAAHDARRERCRDMLYQRSRAAYPAVKFRFIARSITKNFALPDGTR